MSKRSVFTTITPIPAGISREAVIETLHSHVEMIDLNPLVIERFQCKPPSFASAEEFHCTWYTLKDKISYLPRGLATGEVEYYACFHDLAYGLQTHIYAPLGLDIKGKWTVGGSLPGESKQPLELGLSVPKDGLYLREDVDMKCNIMMTSFVKKTLKKSHAVLVDRFVQKAPTSQQDASSQILPLEPRSDTTIPTSFSNPARKYHHLSVPYSDIPNTFENNLHNNIRPLDHSYPHLHTSPPTSPNFRMGSEDQENAGKGNSTTRLGGYIPYSPPPPQSSENHLVNLTSYNHVSSIPLALRSPGIAAKTSVSSDTPPPMVHIPRDPVEMEG